MYILSEEELGGKKNHFQEIETSLYREEYSAI